MIGSVTGANIKDRCNERPGQKDMLSNRFQAVLGRTNAKEN